MMCDKPQYFSLHTFQLSPLHSFPPSSICVCKDIGSDSSIVHEHFGSTKINMLHVRPVKFIRHTLAGFSMHLD